MLKAVATAQPRSLPGDKSRPPLSRTFQPDSSPNQKQKISSPRTLPLPRGCAPPRPVPAATRPLSREIDATRRAARGGARARPVGRHHGGGAWGRQRGAKFGADAKSALRLPLRRRACGARGWPGGMRRSPQARRRGWRAPASAALPDPLAGRVSRGADPARCQGRLMTRANGTRERHARTALFARAPIGGAPAFSPSAKARAASTARPRWNAAYWEAATSLLGARVESHARDRDADVCGFVGFAAGPSSSPGRAGPPVAPGGPETPRAPLGNTQV